MAKTRQASRNEAAVNSRKAFGLSSIFNGAEAIQEKLTSYFPMRKRRSEEPLEKGKRFKNGILGNESSRACTSQGPDIISSTAWNVIVEHIPLRCLMQYALTCKRMTERFREYALTKAFANRFIKSVKKYNEMEVSPMYTDDDPFSVMGHFLKTITFYEKTEDRVAVFIHIYENVKKTVADQKGWGRCLHSFTDKWHFAECDRLLRAILAMEGGRLTNGLSTVLTSAAGSLPELEMEIRTDICELFLHHKFFDQREKSFWLSTLLKLRSTVEERARLFMLLHMNTIKVGQGENKKEVIDWESLCHEGVTSLAESLERILPISEGLLRLYLSQKIEVAEYRWSHSDVFNIMEEVTTFPEPWCLDNFTALMVHEPRLLTIGVFARMSHNFEEEAGTITANVKSLAYRWNLPVENLLREPLMNAMQFMLPTKRKEYYSSIVNANAVLLSDLANGVMTNEVSTELHAQNALLPVMLALTRYL